MQDGYRFTYLEEESTSYKLGKNTQPTEHNKLMQTFLQF